MIGVHVKASLTLNDSCMDGDGNGRLGQKRDNLYKGEAPNLGLKVKAQSSIYNEVVFEARAGASDVEVRVKSSPFLSTGSIELSKRDFSTTNINAMAAYETSLSDS